MKNTRLIPLRRSGPPYFGRSILSAAILSTLLNACGGGSSEFDTESAKIEYSGQQNVTITLSDYVIGDPEAEYAYEILDLPQHGTLSFFSDTAIYVPEEDFEGEDSFMFSVINEQGIEKVAVITIDVKGNTNTEEKLDTQPVFSLQMPTFYATQSDIAIPIVAKANHPHARFELNKEPTFGQLNQSDNQFEYIPLDGFIGVDHFELHVVDDNGKEHVTLITVKVGAKGQLNAKPQQIEQLEDHNSIEASLFHITPSSIRQGKSYEWRQIEGPDVDIFQDGLGNALIQARIGKGQAVFALFEIDADGENLVETKELSADNGQNFANPFTLSFQPFDAQLVSSNTDYAFVFIADVGIVCVDIRLPDQPTITGVFHSGYFVETMEIKGDTLYAAGYGFLDLIDVSSVDDPQLYKTLLIEDLDPLRLHIHGTDVYVDDRSGDIIQVDTEQDTYTDILDAKQENADAFILSIEGDEYLRVESNLLSLYQADPALASTTPILETTWLEDAALARSSIFVLDNSALRVYNKQLDTLFEYKLHNTYSASLKISGDYALVTTPWKGAYVFDISDINNIQFIGNFNTEHNLTDAYISEGIVTLIDSKSGLQVINLNSFEEIKWSSDSFASGLYFSASKAGDYLYVGNEGQGIQTLDVSDPFNIEWVGSRWSPVFNYRSQIFDDMLITSNRWSGVNLYDIGLSPDDPEHLVKLETGDARGVALYQDTMIVANGHLGVSFFDINATENVISFKTEGHAYAVATYEHYALVANSNVGISIYDISTPALPIHIEDIDISGWAYDIIIEGQYAFVAAGHGGISILDLSDMDNVGISRLELPSKTAVVKNISLLGNELYVPAGEAGLYIVDITRPVDPLLSGHYNMADRSHSVAADKDFIYNISYYSGMSLADNTKPELLQDYETELAGTTISYEVEWDSMDELSLACTVSSGSCEVVSLDQTTQSAIVDWQLGSDVGSQQIEISLGNSRFYRKNTDFIEIE